MGRLNSRQRAQRAAMRAMPVCHSPALLLAAAMEDKRSRLRLLPTDLYIYYLRPMLDPVVVGTARVEGVHPTKPAHSITMICPYAIAASRDFLYVSDYECG